MFRNKHHGFTSLYDNSTGDCNTSIGSRSLHENLADSNTAVGYWSLYENTTGYGNTAIGVRAGDGNTSDTACTFVGYNADANGNYKNATAIGYSVIVDASNKAVLGNASVTWTGTLSASNWNNSSDGRFKTNIQENVKGLEFIKKLRPVTYQMDTKALDDFIIQNMPDSVKVMHHADMDFVPSTAIVHSGFIAQEVEQAAQDCGFISSIVTVPADTSTGTFSMAYAEIVVPLVKAVQELSKTVDSLKTILSGTGMKINNNNTGNSETTLQIQLANDIVLYQNEPNPFGDNTVIRYYIPDNLTKSAYIAFYDFYGKEIKKVEITEKGFGKINADTQNLTVGVYAYSLMIDGVIQDTKKMIKE